MSADPMNFLTAGGDDAGNHSDPNSDASGGADASMLLAGGGGGGGGAEQSESGFIVSTDSKKPLNRTTVFLFLLVALGGGGLYLMHLKTGPTAAAAAASKSTEQQAVNNFLNGGQNNMKKMRQMLQDTERVVQQFLTYPSVKQIPLQSLQTNPFRQTPVKGSQQDMSEAEARRLKELEKEQVKRDLDNLSLQSVMRGRVSSCMISGTLVKEGQTIEGFQVEKINANSVIVSRGEFKFELKMAQ